MLSFVFSTVTKNYFINITFIFILTYLVKMFLK